MKRAGTDRERNEAVAYDTWAPPVGRRGFLYASVIGDREVPIIRIGTHIGESLPHGTCTIHSVPSVDVKRAEAIALSLLSPLMSYNYKDCFWGGSSGTEMIIKAIDDAVALSDGYFHRATEVLAGIRNAYVGDDQK